MTSYPSEQDFRADNAMMMAARVYAFGNSLLAGSGGMSDPTRDVMTRLAQAMKALEFNFARAGAVMSWANNVTAPRWGVTPNIKQFTRKPIRAASTINAAASAGQSTLTLAHSNSSATGPAFVVDQHIVIGNGDPASPNAMELGVVVSQSGTTLNLNRPLVRPHTVGEPVFIVPGHFEGISVVTLICETHNYLSKYPPNATGVRSIYEHALRAALSWTAIAEVYEPNHTALSFTGAWTNVGNGGVGSGDPNVASNAEGFKRVAAQGDSFTYHYPVNADCPTVAFHMAANPGTLTTDVWTVTVDGQPYGTFSPPPGTSDPAILSLPWVMRVHVTPEQSHKIVATLTSAATPADHYFDAAILEAKDPPVTVNFKSHRMPNYEFFKFDKHGPIKTTLSADPTATASTIQVGQNTIASGRQMTSATPIPAVNETITITRASDGVKETRKVASISGTSSPFTITLDSALTVDFTTGDAVMIGMQDADITTINTWIDTVQAEFGANHVAFDLDPLFSDPVTGVVQEKFFTQGDKTHFNDWGHAVVNKALLKRLRSLRVLNTELASVVATQPGAVTNKVEFVYSPGGNSVIWAIPSAETAYTPSTPASSVAAHGYRYAALAKAKEARLVAIVGNTAPNANGKLRVQYSLDGGTTWKHLTKRTEGPNQGQAAASNFMDPGATEHTTCQIGPILHTWAANTVFKSNWGLIYPDALSDDALLRLVGVNGGTGNANWISVYLEYR